MVVGRLRDPGNVLPRVASLSRLLWACCSLVYPLFLFARLLNRHPPILFDPSGQLLGPQEESIRPLFVSFLFSSIASLFTRDCAAFDRHASRRGTLYHSCKEYCHPCLSLGSSRDPSCRPYYHFSGIIHLPTYLFASSLSLHP